MNAEYYVYGGFDSAVNAFTKAALIFSGQDFMNIAASLAVLAIMALVARVAWGLVAGGFTGSGTAYLSQAFVPWLVAMVLFVGTVLPKGTLQIYDPVENKTQAVGGIPDIVIFAASVSNLIERSCVDLVTTSGDPVGFTAQAGGIGFLGLDRLAAQPLQSADPTLDQSIGAYVDDCITLTSSVQPNYIQELRDNTTDLLASFGTAASPSNTTSLYTSDVPGGQTTSCQQAYANISTRIQTAGMLDKNFSSPCAEMGFDPTATGAGGVTDCRSRMDAVVDSQLVPGKNSANFVQGAYLAQIFDSVMSSNSAAAGYGNYSILNKASGVAETMNNWLPTIRGVILAVTVALLPFVTLLMLTPAFTKAVKLLVGSFMFLTVWGIIDATVHQFIVDYSYKLMAQARQYNMSLEAMRFFPSQMEKTLAVFGLVRTAGMGLAGMIVSGVMGLGSSIGAAIGSKISGDIEATGAGAEQQMLDPGQKAHLRRHNQMAVPTETLANVASFNDRITSEYGQLAGNMQQNLGAISETGGMDNYLQMRHGQGVAGSYRGQGDVSLNQEVMAQAQAMGIPREQAQQMAAADVNHGAALTELRRLQAQGFTGDAAANAYWAGREADSRQSHSTGTKDGFTMRSPSEGLQTGTWGGVGVTFHDGELVGMTGSQLQFVLESRDGAANELRHSETLSQVSRAAQSFTHSMAHAISSSSTLSRVDALSKNLTDSKGNSINYSEQMQSSLGESLRTSQAIDDKTGQSVDKSAWAKVSAGIGTGAATAGLLKADAEGGSEWKVTTNDGHSYTVHQSAEQTRQLQENWSRTASSIHNRVIAQGASSTSQRALQQIESLTGTTQSVKEYSVASQRAREESRSMSESHSRSAAVAEQQSVAFFRWAGQQFGGGEAGQREAIKHYEDLMARGNVSQVEQDFKAFEAERDIHESLTAGMTPVAGPDTDKVLADTHGAEVKALTPVAAPGQAARLANPAAQVQSAFNAASPDVVDRREIDRHLTSTTDAIHNEAGVIERKGAEIRQDHSGALAAQKLATEKVGGLVAEGVKDDVSRVKNAAVDAKNLATGKLPDDKHIPNGQLR